MDSQLSAKETLWDNTFFRLMKRSYYNFLSPILSSEIMKKIWTYLKERSSTHEIYPLQEKVFNAFNQHELYDLKVVILGQDPYHTPRVANGLAFSVNIPNYMPPSLRNIITEMREDLGIENVKLTKALSRSDYREIFSEDLAKQGVLLLNTALTVERATPNAHKTVWEPFTKAVIKRLSDEKENIIFVLWGNNAKSYKQYIDTHKHHIIESAHPSPFSVNKGFFGSKPFSKINEILKQLGKNPIKWI
jgi:uracil-DNA glycosylase